jgi:hypothetical protein
MKYIKGKFTKLIDLPEGIRGTYRKNTIFKLENEHIYLFDCGYKTVTTKRKLNEIFKELGLSLRIFQVSFCWYVEGDIIFNSLGNRITNFVPFISGMRIPLKEIT